MKVQTRIALLLAAVVAAFLAGLFAFHMYDRAKFRRIAQQRFEERNRSFDEFLRKHGEPLQVLAEYDTCWDEMVTAIMSRQKAWFDQKVNQSTLEGYHANAIWIYPIAGPRSHDVNNLDAPDLGDVPVPREAFAEIFAIDRFAHFFVQTPKGIMEIRGATVHSSRDFRRETPPRGYFFAGRLWSNSVLQEMEMFTGNKISISTDATQKIEQVDEQDGGIAFARQLRGYDGKPVAQLIVRNDSPVVRELNRTSERLLIALCVFALVLMLLMSLALVRWVNRPLRQIMESLTRNDLKPVERMAQHSSEFGALARTIHKFFEQRDNLIREMEERRATEEALRKREEELRHSQKMEAIGRLAGGVAHDFNNLLTAIIGYAELICNRTQHPEQVRQNAELILKAGEQAATLTKQLLAFSRKSMLQPKVVDLNELIVDMEKLLRRVIGERFDLQTRPHARDGRVRADPSQIEQVVLNLGVNARDAMPTGGKLTIFTANVALTAEQAHKIATSLPAGEYVTLSVTDTGTGMDEETQSRIFEPFFTTKGPGKGTGLGLATVYGIVRQSGGGIQVESQVGKGSTFTIYLPLEIAPIDYVKPEPVPLERGRAFETVLVAEDEEIVRELVCDVLSDQGYTVLCAPNGVEALKLARTYDGKIHLLVTDVIMPQMNGHELAEQLWHIRPDTKVLYVSGYSNNDLDDHGELDPRYELLQKPFTPQTLARKIHEVMREDASVPAETPVTTPV